MSNERVVSITTGQPCGPGSQEELRTRTVILTQLVLALWCLGLFGSLALGVTFLAGGEPQASLWCAWTFGVLLMLAVIQLVSGRVAPILKEWGESS